MKPDWLLMISGVVGAAINSIGNIGFQAMYGMLINAVYGKGDHDVAWYAKALGFCAFMLGFGILIQCTLNFFP